MGRILLTSACILGMAVAAQANLIDFGYAEPTSTYGINPAEEALYLKSLGYTGLTYLDKMNQGGTWDQTFHDTTVLTASITGNTASLTWDLTGTGYLLGLVTLKDGNDGENKGRYHIYGVTADQTVESGLAQTVSYFDPSGLGKNISHVSFWGTAAPTPDGGSTAAMLGLGMLGLGFLARRKA